jgi:hypothetical protein
MGSIGVAAFIARIAFVVLVGAGWVRGALGVKGTFVFVGLAAIAYAAFPRMSVGGDSLVTSALAVLDVALVFIVAKGDVRIT